MAKSKEAQIGDLSSQIKQLSNKKRWCKGDPESLREIDAQIKDLEQQRDTLRRSA
jgi:hypothetical protein